MVPPALVAQTLGQYARGWAARVRNGDSGVLPVVAGMVLIAVVFQAISPNHVFLSAGNIVNLFQQSAVFMVLAMAECFVLVLGEIDLSVGFVGPLGGIITVQLVQPSTTNWPWWAAIIAALLVCALVGAVMGTLITRLRVPSFIVTLAGFLDLQRCRPDRPQLRPLLGLSQPDRQLRRTSRRSPTSCTATSTR